jgi:hypothetical protein
VSAFFMGMLLCYFFVAQRSMGMLVVVLFGHFTYPLFSLSALPLFVNIRNHALFSRLKPGLLFKYATWISIICYLIILAIMLAAPQVLLIEKYTMELNMYLLPVSVVLVVWYLWQLLNGFRGLEYATAPSGFKNYLIKTAGVIVFIMAASYIVSTVSIPETVFTPVVFLMNVFQQSIDNPFVSLISHITYFGPAIIIIVWLYKSFAKTVAKMGDSAIIYFLFASFLSLGSESRQFIHFYPFMVIVLMQTINEIVFSRQQVVLFVVLSLIFSKCWFNINVPGIFEQYDFTHFPDQRYFMNQGPFMSDTGYYINLGIVCVLTALTWALFRKSIQSRKQAVV